MRQYVGREARHHGAQGRQPPAARPAEEECHGHGQHEQPVGRHDVYLVYAEAEAQVQRHVEAEP